MGCEKNCGPHVIKATSCLVSIAPVTACDGSRYFTTIYPNHADFLSKPPWGCSPVQLGLAGLLTDVTVYSRWEWRKRSRNSNFNPLTRFLTPAGDFLNPLTASLRFTFVLNLHPSGSVSLFHTHARTQLHINLIDVELSVLQGGTHLSKMWMPVLQSVNWGQGGLC